MVKEIYLSTIKYDSNVKFGVSPWFVCHSLMSKSRDKSVPSLYFHVSLSFNAYIHFLLSSHCPLVLAIWAWKNSHQERISSGPLVVTFSSPHCLFWIIKVPPGPRCSSSPEHRAKSANSMLPRKPTLDAIANPWYSHCLIYFLPSKSLLSPCPSALAQGVWNHACVLGIPLFSEIGYPCSISSMRRKQKNNGPGLQQSEWKVDRRPELSRVFYLVDIGIREKRTEIAAVCVSQLSDSGRPQALLESPSGWRINNPMLIPIFGISIG